MRLSTLTLKIATLELTKDDLAHIAYALECLEIDHEEWKHLTPNQIFEWEQEIEALASKVRKVEVVMEDLSR